MKKILLIIISLGVGILITYFFLNNNTYAKGEYLVYALQAGSYTNLDNAIKYRDDINNGIIVKDNNEYIRILKNKYPVVADKINTAPMIIYINTFSHD